jgi:hypothetical protein
MTQRVAGKLTQRPIRDATTHGVDGYLSHCIYCKHGIFKNQPHEWRNCDGIVHTECYQKHNT